MKAKVSTLVLLLVSTCCVRHKATPVIQLRGFEVSPPEVSPPSPGCVLGIVEPICGGSLETCRRMHEEYEQRITEMCAGQNLIHNETVLVGTSTPPEPPKVAELIDGKCSICLSEHEKSTVTMDGYGSCTLLACAPGHYDEDGKWVPPVACNTCTYTGHCSRGHSIVVTFKQ